MVIAFDPKKSNDRHVRLGARVILRGGLVSARATFSLSITSPPESINIGG